jgi:hypothetical protein
MYIYVYICIYTYICICINVRRELGTRMYKDTRKFVLKNGFSLVLGHVLVDEVKMR